MSNPHDTEKHVTFTVDAKEFQLLTALMAPLYFDESEGKSIWVVSTRPDTRQWVVRDDDDRYSVVRITGASDTRFNFGDGETGWSFPVPESILMCIGKLSAIDGFEAITLTLSDTMITVSQADVELSIPQNHKVVAPPIVPAIDTAAEVVVNAAQLWCILSEARRWPASGDCGGMNPPMRCTVGPDSQHMTITVDWTTEKNGVCTYRLPARWVHQGRLFEEPITFTMPHTPILTVVRDPMNAEILGEVTMSIPGSGGTHVVLHNESFEFHAPVVNEDTHWGQDLGDVLGDTHFRWVNAGHVMVWPDDFEEGPIKLSRLPSDPQSPYQYRASVVVCDDIIPNVDLYNEINAINAKASGGYRLVVMTDKVVAMSDYTIENYKELGRHMEAFAKGVTGIGKLLSPLTVQFTR